MIEQEIQIQTPDGTASSVVYHPENDRRFPGFIFVTDIGGIRASQREMARRIAKEGYVVLLPNVFYRTSEPPVFNFPFKPGDERSMKRIGELSGPLTPEAVERDASAYVDFLASREYVTEGAMGVVGLCLGGALAVRIAAAKPDRIAAAASFHGGRLYVDGPDSPHLLLPKIRAELYFGHAVEDRSMPQDAIDKLNRALRDWGGAYQSEVYDDAHHGWTVPDSPAYNQPQAERAFEKLKGLLNRRLGSTHAAQA